jgi:hypothetical protein
MPWVDIVVLYRVTLDGVGGGVEQDDAGAIIVGYNIRIYLVVIAPLIQLDAVAVGTCSIAIVVRVVELDDVVLTITVCARGGEEVNA